jgi:hypothetical protein
VRARALMMCRVMAAVRVESGMTRWYATPAEAEDNRLYGVHHRE